MILARRVALNGVQLDSLDNRILISAIDEAAGRDNISAVSLGAGDGQRGQTGQTGFSMDTSYADRIYEMHRLLETLYPLTLAAALLLGAVLPGLTVLHASKELSILRALGAKIGKCVGLYVLAQVLCALAGLVLGLALVLAIQRPEFTAVARPFGVYLLAHLAACAAGSGVFAWLCARKHVLAQLQAKE